MIKDGENKLLFDLVEAPKLKMLEIESRKDKDQFFDSLGGWNQDDKLGKNRAK